MAHGTSDAAPPSPDVLQVQHQIRANAAELQDYFADLYKWEKTIGQEEAARKLVPPPRSAVPLPRKHTAVSVASTLSPTRQVAAPSAATDAKRADAHTYDKGYKKWESFDVDAALQDADSDHKSQRNSRAVRVSEPATNTKKSTAAIKKAIAATPKAQSAASVTPSKSREEIEREDGNEHYKRGDYVAAINSYTRALGFNSRNVVVLSNRAMAYLKNKEYSKAEDDCTLALKIDDTHVKSYSRRGSARNALGKHRLALLDFEQAQTLDPKSKQIASQVTATMELLRAAIKRAPTRTQFSIKVVGDPPATPPEAESSLVEVAEDKENVARGANEKCVIIEEIVYPVKEEEQKPVVVSPLPAPTTVAPVPRATRGAMLPKLPVKSPASSYEFLRVWKTLAPKGDAERIQQLLQLRADYLRMLTPTTLPALFKNSIESELFCEIFGTVRQTMDVAGQDKSFVVGLVIELPRVPRFSMVVMFLSEKEKGDVAWIFDSLAQSEEQGSDLKAMLQALKPQYGLK